MMQTQKHERARSRTRPEIYLEILKKCRTPQIKSHIIFHCNINFLMFRVYFRRLEKQGYLTKTGYKYQTTPDGKKLIIELLMLKPMFNL